jgi:class 3 adenylate cyclase
VCVDAFFAVPITVGGVFSPSLQPIRDLAEGTERVAAGDYSQRLPVVQDDDLGALAASFNRMQAGLAERQRLQVAFGTYVDPVLAARLLEQGDDVFTGERRQVTVMFVDVRDFTPFAEANTAEDTVARLNALFEIVVPAVVDAGGHVNKFLGDGAMAVFGAPNDLADHADAAVAAAVLIHRARGTKIAEQPPSTATDARPTRTGMRSPRQTSFRAWHTPRPRASQCCGPAFHAARSRRADRGVLTVGGWRIGCRANSGVAKQSVSASNHTQGNNLRCRQ